MHSLKPIDYIWLEKLIRTIKFTWIKKSSNLNWDGSVPNNWINDFLSYITHWLAKINLIIICLRIIFVNQNKSCDLSLGEGMWSYFWFI